MEPSLAPGKARRRRTSKTCTRCRRRKIRCDFQYPTCGACAAARVACLGYDAINGIERPRNSVISLLEEEIARVELDLANGQAERRRREEQQQQASPEHEAASQTQASESLAVKRLTTRLAVAAATGTADDLVDQGESLLPLASSFFLSGSPVPPLSGLRDVSSGPQYGLSAPSGNPTQAVPVSSTPRHVAVIMLKHYCSIYRPQYPAVEESDLLAAFDRVYDHDSPTDFDIFCVHITLAISTTTLMYRDEGRAATATSGFWATALAHLHHLDRGHDGPVNGWEAWERLQALQLLTHYGYLNPKDVDCVRSAAAAMRLALQLGLHQEIPPTEQSEQSMSASVANRRRVLFWHTFSIDVASCHTTIKPCTLVLASITTKKPSLDSTATPTSHMWALREIEAEVTRYLYYPYLGTPGTERGENGGDGTDDDADVDKWCAGIRSRLDAWHYATRQSVTLSEKVEFYELHYHMQRLRLYRPSPRCPRPSPTGCQEALTASVSVLRELDVIARLGKLFYIWHAAHCLVEASACLLALVLVGTASRSPQPGDAADEPQSTFGIREEDAPVLQRHLRLFPGILWKMSRRWPAVVHHASALETLAVAVSDRLEKWQTGHVGGDTAAERVELSKLKTTIVGLSRFSPFPTGLEEEEAHGACRGGGTMADPGENSSQAQTSDARIWDMPTNETEAATVVAENDGPSGPNDPGAFWTAPPPLQEGMAWVAGNTTAALANVDTALPDDWDFAGMGFEEIFAALIQQQDIGEQGILPLGEV